MTRSLAWILAEQCWEIYRDLRWHSFAICLFDFLYPSLLGMGNFDVKLKKTLHFKTFTRLPLSMSILFTVKSLIRADTTNGSSVVSSRTREELVSSKLILQFFVGLDLFTMVPMDRTLMVLGFLMVMLLKDLRLGGVQSGVVRVSHIGISPGIFYHINLSTGSIRLLFFSLLDEVEPLES
ncbi:hypothetical protein V6N11_019711 [Hibiscus sabdariffa]|uniref:Uncharacterized protein n=1 Tax=Hibiscus sabdariffa TaxID=183260 RepID=A0ABR2NM33_9ROSI